MMANGGVGETTYMKCATCGTDNLPEARYCSNCSVSLETQPRDAESVLNCTNCGKENLPSARFCAACGTAIEQLAGRQPDQIYCTSCGTTNQASERSCANCGNSLRAPIPHDGDPKDAPVTEESIGFWIRAGALALDIVILFVALLVTGAISSAIPLGRVLIIPLFYIGCT